MALFQVLEMGFWGMQCVYIVHRLSLRDARKLVLLAEMASSVPFRQVGSAVGVLSLCEHGRGVVGGPRD